MIIAVVSCRTAPWVPTVSFADRIAVTAGIMAARLLIRLPAYIFMAHPNLFVNIRIIP